MIVTIDGPIATGKSTIAKKLAEKLGFIFFDTGAMYRSLTFGIIKHKVDFDDPFALKNYLDAFKFDMKLYRGNKRYFVDEEDVTEKIRSTEVTSLVSKVSAIPSVRAKLLALQKELAEGINAVFEGRDMGTVVFPDADLKIFLTGRLEVRAKRRYEEMCKRFPEECKNLTIEKLMEDVQRRDDYDSKRDIAPLIKAHDAVEIDTSDLTPDEVVHKILEYRDSLPAQ